MAPVDTTQSPETPDVELAARARAAVQQRADLVVLLDVEGRITEVNDAAERVLGVSPSWLRGRRAIELIHPEDQEFSRRVLSALRQRAAPKGLPTVVRLHHADGQWRTVAAVATFLGEHPILGGVVVHIRMIQDVSELFEVSLPAGATDTEVQVDLQAGASGTGGRWAAPPAAGEATYGPPGPASVTVAYPPPPHGTATPAGSISQPGGVAEAASWATSGMAHPRDTFQALVQNSSDITAVVDADGTIRYASPAAANVFGRPAVELMGSTLQEWIEPDDRPQLAAAILGEPGMGESPVLQLRVPTPAEEEPYRYLEGRLTDLRGVPAVGGFVVNARDVTERVLAERAVIESEARYRRLATTARALIYRFRLVPTPGFDYVSPSATGMVGYTPEDHYAMPDLGQRLVHPDDQARLASMMTSDPPQPVLIRWVHRDGRLLWTEHWFVKVRNDKGELVAIEGMAIDVTDRVEAEEALAARKALLGALVEVSDRGIVALDHTGSLLLANSRARLLLGLSDEDSDLHAVHFVDIAGHPVDLCGVDAVRACSPEARAERCAEEAAAREAAAGSGGGDGPSAAPVQEPEDDGETVLGVVVPPEGEGPSGDGAVRARVRWLALTARALPETSDEPGSPCAVLYFSDLERRISHDRALLERVRPVH